MPTIAENLARVQESLAAACRKAGRPRAEVDLIAVSKTHSLPCLIQAAEAGQLLFGENRVQEFAEKSTALAPHKFTVELGRAQPLEPSTKPLEIHLIGHLQSNKAARAVKLFSSVDTLDSLRLAERLEHEAASLGRRLPILLEIKLSHEPSKEGLAPGNSELSALLERLPDFEHLVPQGLMTVAPFDENPENARDSFRALRKLRDALASRHPKLTFDTLSMGMSGDYAVAIEEGSTQVRIGTAIFGPRPKIAGPS